MSQPNERYAPNFCELTGNNKASYSVDFRYAQHSVVLPDLHTTHCTTLVLCVQVTLYVLHSYTPSGTVPGVPPFLADLEFRVNTTLYTTHYPLLVSSSSSFPPSSGLDSIRNMAKSSRYLFPARLIRMIFLVSPCETAGLYD